MPTFLFSRHNIQLVMFWATSMASTNSVLWLDAVEALFKDASTILAECRSVIWMNIFRVSHNMRVGPLLLPTRYSR